VVGILLGLSIVTVVFDDSRAGNRRLQAFNALTAAIAESRSSGAMLLEVLGHLMQAMRAKVGWIRLREGERLVLHQHAGLGQKLGVLRREVPFAGSFVEMMRPDRDPIIANFDSLDRELKHAASEFGLDHLAILPLRGNSSLLGTVALGMKGQREYSSKEKTFLSTTTSHLGLALENVLLFERVMESHHRWINTFDSIDDMILVHDAEQKIIRANRAIVSKLGLDVRDLPGLHCRQLLPNAPETCPYCLRAGQGIVDAPDPCFGGFSTVSTSSYTEESGTEKGTIHVIRDTTELHIAEERFRLLFEKMKEAVFIASPQGKLLECNEAFVHMLGYGDKAEVLSLDLNRLLYSDPEHRAAYQAALEREGFLRNYEFVYTRKDGHRITLLENSFATRGPSGDILRCQGFLFDITEQVRAGEEIRRSNRELHALNAIAIAAARTFDLEEVATVALRHAIELSGAISGSVLILEPGSSTLRLHACEGPQDNVAAGQSYRLSPQFWAEFAGDKTELITARTLEHLPLEVRAALDSQMRHALCVAMWTREREPLGLLLVSRREDREFTGREHELMITIARQLAISMERARLYHQSTRAYQDLRNAQEQLLQSEKMSALGRMISGVAHELNNPLTAMLGYAQLLEGEELGERAKDFLAKLYKQTQRTQRIVQNLLSFSRQRKPQKGEVNVAQVVEDTLALREFDLKLHNIFVHRSFLPVSTVVADAHQLEQVFLNIINNAADAIQETSRPGKLEVSIFEDCGFACVQFHDSGPGIAELGRIFDPFYTTKRLGKGTGLGLSICYGILKEHGGEIIASNHERGGAVFQVRLPIAPAEPLAAAESQNEDSVPGEYDASKPFN
jgi:two-component system NtrC family sensor kinase